ncbi:DUF5050 domain-containing protein [Evansella tamaricis]|uniref:DUF5050 domain-containing protein n=1 Tax=Evansella tamaricis TaxID=2069301 RepID=A0ABS6JLX8_9BACI|nr:DUF5050 domain-containing protein [Evansella tamaricis]MBU9713857.1 DUF5050 domain-containing protein [Evansella tamaricis]
MNYFEILGVDVHASTDEIKRAYRQMAKLHHPDVGGDPFKFKQGQKAYQVLMNQTLRQQHENNTGQDRRTKSPRSFTWKDINVPPKRNSYAESSYTYKKLFPEISPGTVGANLLNGGFVATDGDYVYYSCKKGLYKMREDGSSISKLMYDEVRYINVKRNDLFCVTDTGIHKINLVTNEVTKLINRVVTNFVVYGNRLYFLIPNQSGVFSTDINGQDPTFINEEVQSMILKDEWIYYIGGSNGVPQLYKMRTNGTENHMIMKKEVGTFDIVDRSIYFSNQSSPLGNLSKIFANGKTIYPIKDFYPSHLLISDNKVIYIDGSESRNKGGLFISRLNYMDNVQLAHPDKKVFQGINLVGDWIYYHDRHGLYRVHKENYIREKVD